MERLTKYCSFCQRYGKSPGRFKFTLRDDTTFNYSIIVDIMYIDGNPVLHVIDEATRFQAARWLQNISAKHTWDSLRLCWIDVYLGPPDYLHHDAGTNFVSKEFRQFALSMVITTKAVPVEAHWSIGIVERYHAMLRRAYLIIKEELCNINGTGINKDIGLQMAVKAVNDTAGPDGLVPTLLVFGAYPRMLSFDPPAPTILQRAAAINKAMDEVRKIRDQRMVADALNTRNGPLVNPLHDLPLNSEVLVWREKRGWAGPFRLLNISNETCQVELPSGPTNFRSTCVKPFYTEVHPDIEAPLPTEAMPRADATPQTIIPVIPPAGTTSQTVIPVIPPAGFVPQAVIPDIPPAGSPLQAAIRKQPTRARRPPVRYQGVADILISFQNQPTHTPFIESRQKEISGLLEKGVFEVVLASDVPKGVRIFNSRFVDEMKNIGTAAAFEKSRLVVQAYNDEGKSMVLTQAPTIQRMSQRLILALAAIMIDSCNLYVRDITQAYVQSTTSLNRKFYVRPPQELGLRGDAILKIIKPLYGVPEAGAHWFNTYHSHHIKKLSMAQSTYDTCLLHTTNTDGFGVVGLQTDDTLMLADKNFAAAEEKELNAATLLAKNREKLTKSCSIKFNGGYIKLQTDGIHLTQENQCECLKLVTLKEIDLTGSRGQVRKAVAPKDQYIAQRARGAYIATVSQPEAAFDLSYAAQVINPQENDVKFLNKRLQWQMENSERRLRFVPLDSTTLKLVVFTDASFANNQDYSSQIGYVIVLADAGNRANIIHWSSIKCKRVTRSVLASELYSMAHGFDAGAVIKSTTENIMNISLPMIICTDSRSLYDCLVKLGSTQEKRLMVDVMCLRQSYERREIMEIKWIDGDSNPADSMTKAKPSQALQRLIDTNTINMKETGWVERANVPVT